MDKFKKYLAIVIKYHFWIICGLMLVTATGCWWLATASLAGQFGARKTKLDQTFTSIKVPPNPPNQGVIDKVHQQHDVLKGTVYKAWETLYQEQKKNNPLPPVLSEDFKQQFEKLKPKEELPPAYREQYQSFIARYVPTLLERIDARRPAGSNARAGAAGGNRGGGGPGGAERRAAPGVAPAAGGPGVRPAAGAASDAAAEQDRVGTVEWIKSDYENLEHQFEWLETPSTLAIILAQEDLWVYEALARVVRRTNEGATGSGNAAVKRINALEIGQNAVKAWKSAQGSIVSVGGPGAAATPGATATAAAAAPAPGGGAASEELNRRQLMAERYVDDKGKPLSYTPEYPYAKHPCNEFKRMPIHLDFVMDQRRLPKLLVECANSTMPIEVQHIRILKSASGAGAGSTTTGSAGQPSASTSSKSGDSGASLSSSDDREVEICGVIYIYNPPDRAKLGTGSLAEKPADAAAPSAPATPAPAAAPSNPATPAAIPAAAPGKTPAAAPGAAAPGAPTGAAAPGAPPAAAPGAAVPATPPAAAPGKPSKP